jgi:DNA-binding winged helix-turn-helix (wHTH) protein
MLYAFGDAILDTQRHELRLADQLVKLEPKAYQVLVYLVHHHDRVVSKAELLAALWPGANVHDSAVPRCISAIRQAMGHGHNRHQVIQTLHGTGYRCIVPVLTYPSAGPEAEAAPLHSRDPADLSRTASPASTEDRAHATVPSNVPARTEARTGQCCAACGHANAPAARFCTLCGAPLPVRCPSCQRRIPRPVSFCPACGKRLPAPSG